MKLALLILSLITAPAIGTVDLPSEMSAGRYAVKISGFWCTSCGRAMQNELKALPEISEAEFDFESETVFITVKLDKTLKLSALRKALSRASKRVNIGSKLDVTNVIYRP